MRDDREAKQTRFLVVLLGAIGDVVRGLNLVNAIKDHYAGAHLTWLVEPASAPIVKLHPRIDEVLVFRRKEGVKGFLEIRRELSQRTFDITLDLQRHFKSGVFSWLSRAPKRVGFHRRDGKEFNWVFNTCTIPEMGEQISKVEHYLAFLKEIDIPRPSQLSSGLEGITLQQFAPEWSGLLAERYVGLVLGSSWDSKDWPEEGYHGLLAHVGAIGVDQVVLIGDRSKAEMAARLEALDSPLPVLNLVGRTSLIEVVGLIQGATACVGPDSGPAHISGAVSTPHVTLFGPTSMSRNVPRGCEELSISSKVGCSPCKRRVCPGLGKICMRLISPEQVAERLKTAIARG